MTHKEALNNLFLFFGTMACLLLAGCKSPMQSDETMPEVGDFALIQNSLVSIPNNSEIDLGEIENTEEFHFALTNQGDRDIVDINISTNNPEFIVQPAKISILQPASKFGVEQLLKLTIVHGTAASRVGPAPVLEPGPQLSELHLQGTTTNAEGDSLDIEFAVDLATAIKLADVQVFHSNGEVNLFLPNGTISGNGLPGQIRFYEVPNGQVTIQNTGNVALSIDVSAHRYPEVVELPSFELAPGESDTANWPYERLSGSDSFRFILDTDNTITDRVRLPIQDDGKVYIILTGPHPTQPEMTVRN